MDKSLDKSIQSTDYIYYCQSFISNARKFVPAGLYNGYQPPPRVGDEPDLDFTNRLNPSR